MASVLTVPVTAATLPEHEALDDAAHAAIAETEDEDYKWLTDRLDAHSAELAQLRAQLDNKQSELLLAFNQSNEQSRLLIEAQSTMIANLLSSVTALSESALLRSIPNNSESSSQTDPPVETVTVETVVPAESEQTQEQPAVDANAKKRRRI